MSSFPLNYDHYMLIHTLQRSWPELQEACQPFLRLFKGGDMQLALAQELPSIAGTIDFEGLWKCLPAEIKSMLVRKCDGQM
jgi:hypothetical protein